MCAHATSAHDFPLSCSVFLSLSTSLSLSLSFSLSPSNKHERLRKRERCELVRVNKMQRPIRLQID